MILANPEHIKLLTQDPLTILPSLVQGKTFKSWHEKSYYLRDTVSQEIIKSMYLIIKDALVKIGDRNKSLCDKYLNDLDVFWLALTDENAAIIELNTTIDNKN